MMYKTLLPFFVLFVCLTSFSQTDSSAEVKQTIVTFFEGFHQQDSIIMQSVTSDDMTLRSIGPQKDGSTALSSPTTRAAFLKSILSIPETMTFEERLLDFQIAVDGAMAIAWTPYEFYFNDQFSHCGVNNFTLFNTNGQWKIIAIVDTRRKECDFSQ